MDRKVALVTGSSRGIGKAIAILFAKNGYDVIVNYNGNEQAALDTLAKVHEYSSNSIVCKANVANEEEVTQMFKFIKETYGKLDVLVNNSGITKDGLALRMSSDDFMKVIDVNLKGTFLCSREASKLMIKKKQGAIINMASIVGVTGNSGQVNYSASKAGVIGLTKSLAKELAARNIRVNAIAPGFIQTEMTDVLSDDVKDAMLQQIPLRCLGDVEDIAEMSLFLASDASKYITGQVMHVDGGMYM